MATSLLPLFPLGTVLLPGAPLPLHIFEARYRRLAADLLDLPPEQRRFGVVAIRQGSEVGAGRVGSLYDVGCVAVVTELETEGDGTYLVRSVGTTRFRLTAVDDDLPYTRASVDWLDEPLGPVGGLPGLVEQRYADYRRVLGGLRAVALEVAELPADPRLLSYLVAATVLAEVHDRQAFLAAPDAAERLAVEARWLARETVLLRELSAVPAAGLLDVSLSVN